MRVDTGTEEDLPAAPLPRTSHFWREIRLFVVAHLMLIGAIAALFVAYYAGTGRPGIAAFANVSSVASSVILGGSYCVMAAFLLWRLPPTTGRSLRTLGLRWPGRQDVGIIAAGLLALVIVRLLIGALLVSSGNAHHVQVGCEHVHAGTRSPLATVLFVLQLAVIAPFAEELLYRMLFFRTLTRRMPWLPAAVLSSALFGALHADLVLFPALAALGFINAMVYLRSGNIFTSIIIHSANNFVAASALIG